MDSKNQEPVIAKIKINKKTAELEIVEVSAKELDKQIKKEAKLSQANKKTLDEATRRAEKAMTMTGTQIMMGKLDDDSNISNRQKTFKKVLSVIFFVLIVGVLVYTFLSDFVFSDKSTMASWSEVVEILSKNWYYIICALVCMSLMIILKGLKHSVLCRKLTRKWHFKTCMETATLGLYYNYITPLAVGGQPFEIYYLAKHGVQGGTAASLPIITFFLNQLAMVVFGLISLVLLPLNSLNVSLGMVPATITVMAGIGLACCIAVPGLTVLFSASPRIGSKLVGFVMFLGGKLKLVKNPRVTSFKTMKNVIQNSRCIKKVAATPWLFLTEFVLSLGEALALTSISYFTLRFFGWDDPNHGGFVEWVLILQLCFILYSAISFIPTPGNSGGAELSFSLIFKKSLFAGLVFPAMVTWRVISFYMFIIIGFSFLSYKKRMEKKLIAKQNNFTDINR